jgi:hypothetical protein
MKLLPVFLALRWKRLWCKHRWRPGMCRFYPVRVCGKCERSEAISKERFYAEFGYSFDALKSQLNDCLGKGRI